MHYRERLVCLKGVIIICSCFNISSGILYGQENTDSCQTITRYTRGTIHCPEKKVIYIKKVQFDSTCCETDSSTCQPEEYPEHFIAHCKYMSYCEVPFDPSNTPYDKYQHLNIIYRCEEQCISMQPNTASNITCGSLSLIKIAKALVDNSACPTYLYRSNSSMISDDVTMNISRLCDGKSVCGVPLNKYSGRVVNIYFQCQWENVKTEVTTESNLHTNNVNEGKTTKDNTVTNMKTKDTSVSNSSTHNFNQVTTTKDSTGGLNCISFNNHTTGHIQCVKDKRIRIKAAWVDKHNCSQVKINFQPPNSPNITQDLTKLCSGRTCCTFPFFTNVNDSILIIKYECICKILSN